MPRKKKDKVKKDKGVKQTVKQQVKQSVKVVIGDVSKKPTRRARTTRKKEVGLKPIEASRGEVNALFTQPYPRFIVSAPSQPTPSQSISLLEQEKIRKDLVGSIQGTLQTYLNNGILDKNLNSKPRQDLESTLIQEEATIRPQKIAGYITEREDTEELPTMFIKKKRNLVPNPKGGRRIEFEGSSFKKYIKKGYSYDEVNKKWIEPQQERGTQTERPPPPNRKPPPLPSKGKITRIESSSSSVEDLPIAYSEDDIQKVLEEQGMFKYGGKVNKKKKK